MSESRTYSVPGMRCGHCKTAVTEELGAVSGVQRVDVDLESRIVTVTGAQLDDGTLRVAIGEAGYEAEDVPV